MSVCNYLPLPDPDYNPLETLWMVDDRWNIVFVSDESRVTFGGGTPIDVSLGHFFFGPELVSASTGWATG